MSRRAIGLIAVSFLGLATLVWAQQPVAQSGEWIVRMLGRYQITPTQISDGQVGTVGLTNHGAVRVAIEKHDSTPLEPSEDIRINGAHPSVGLGISTPQTIRFVEAIDQAVCRGSTVQSVNINLSAASGNTQVVSLVSGQIIYGCGFNLQTDNTVDFSWVRGLGTNCGTGAATIETRAFSSAVGFTITNPNGGAPQFRTNAGDALCVGRSASVILKGRLTYVQQ